MTPYRDGWRRVARAPWIVALVWLVTTAVAAPFAVALRGLIAADLGASLEAESAAAGVNHDWMQEFGGRAGQAGALASTFTPAIIGGAAVAENLGRLMDNARPPMFLLFAGVLYLAVWTFLSGGIIDRYARDRALRPAAFLWASSVYFLRFLRLGLVALVAYGLIFGWFYPLLLNRLFQSWTSDLDNERTVVAIRAAVYLLLGFALGACTLVFDYAKVRAVVEDRRSMLAALAAALRFIRHNRTRVAVLLTANAATLAGVLFVYALVAPGAGSAGWAMWAALACGQLYVVARLWVKLLFWASETALFQSRLAHAGYVATPAPRWPDSAAAEQLGAGSDSAFPPPGSRQASANL